jgi:hypothetical protein
MERQATAAPTFTPEPATAAATAAAPAAAPASEPISAPTEAPPKATPVADVDDDRLMGLFRKATGTAFDPNSRLDKSRLGELRSLISSRPELLGQSDTKIALEWYRSKR